MFVTQLTTSVDNVTDAKHGWKKMRVGEKNVESIQFIFQVCIYLLTNGAFLAPTAFLLFLDLCFNRTRASICKLQFGLNACVVHADQAQILVCLHDITRYVGSVSARVIIWITQCVQQHFCDNH